MNPKELEALNLKFEQSERLKYETIWSKQDYSSKEHGFYDFVRPHLSETGYNLEIGCGSGSLMRKLRKEGVYVFGMDITLKHIIILTDGLLLEMPAWDMSCIDSNTFDVSFSTDVLEHIPTELIPATIKEIDRVTRVKTVHEIATWPDHKYQGFDVHLTVKPLEWWQEQFKDCKCGVILKERKLWR